MLLVKTRIGKSNIHGLGLFADEFIPKGTILWKFVPGFDLKFSDDDLKKMPEVARDFMRNYEYLSKKSGLHILCIDNARFYNHSDNPNTTGVDMDGTEREDADIAIWDIHPGEEITYNYKEWDANAEERGII